MGFFKWFREKKEEQLILEREIKIILHNIRFGMKEIKSLIELSLMRTSKKK